MRCAVAVSYTMCDGQMIRVWVEHPPSPASSSSRPVWGLHCCCRFHLSKEDSTRASRSQNLQGHNTCLAELNKFIAFPETWATENWWFYIHIYFFNFVNQDKSDWICPHVLWEMQPLTFFLIKKNLASWHWLVPCVSDIQSALASKEWTVTTAADSLLSTSFPRARGPQSGRSPPPCLPPEHSLSSLTAPFKNAENNGGHLHYRGFSFMLRIP